ncbi:nicotinate-nucleotide adenylyltransferase [Neisseriaceae bacterium TC5R-5]|nr:nicotinate-nucleotide adenylyltransferase [Neisseriaceae bacterium TC5R-5]
MSTRLGLFGGTFDPIHLAHLRMAEAFATELELDQVKLIPAGQPYHRQQQPGASPQQRLEMVTLAIANHPQLSVDDREIKRPHAAYTIDTLTEIRQAIGQEAELWFLIGSDSLATLHTWQRWQELLTLANLAIAMRPGFNPQRLAPPVQQLWQQRQVADFSNRSTSGTIRPLVLPAIEMSASNIRQRLAQQDSVETLIPATVLSYIRQHGLYQTI